jgi:hypothetical protein
MSARLSNERGALCFSQRSMSLFGGNSVDLFGLVVLPSAEDYVGSLSESIISLMKLEIDLSCI